MVTRREHWQSVYETKPATDVSWYAAHLEESLRLIKAAARPEARVIDVGAGASTLVDDLLDAGYRHLTVLDISPAALEIARRRLGERSELVQWVAADVTTAELTEGAFDVWHDRAVFHFLTEERDRERYVAQVRSAVAPGGQVIMGTFSLEGPATCSGLAVARYDATSLARVFGAGFSLTHGVAATHVTPAGREQHFQYSVLTRGAAAAT